MKKLFIFIVSIVMLMSTGLCSKADVVPMPSIAQKLTSLMDYPDYQKITPDNIKSILVRRFTVAGGFNQEFKEEDKIVEIYDWLKTIFLAGETKYSCTDNTTLFIFTLKDDSKVMIEIECDWAVINRKHYNIYIPPQKYKHVPFKMYL